MSALPKRLSRAAAIAVLTGFGFSGTALAQAVCSNTPTGNQYVDCKSTRSGDLDSNGNITIDLGSTITITSPNREEAVYGRHSGTGNIDIDITGGTFQTTGTGAEGIFTLHSGTGSIDIDVTDATITTGTATTPASAAEGVHGQHRASGDVNIRIRGTDITTYGSSTNKRISDGAHGIYGVHGTGSLEGHMMIDFRDGTITTNGRLDHGILGWITDFDKNNERNMIINVEDTTITTSNADTTFGSQGITAINNGKGKIDIDATRATISTASRGGRGINARKASQGHQEDRIEIDVTGGSIETTGAGAGGIFAKLENQNADSTGTAPTDGSARVAVNVDGTTLTTTGDAVRAWNDGGEGDTRVDVRDSTITVSDSGAQGVVGKHTTRGNGNVYVGVTGTSSITTTGSLGYGIHGRHEGTGALEIDFSGNAITTGGDYGYGLYGRHKGDGKIDIKLSGDGSVITINGEEGIGIYGQHDDSDTGSNMGDLDIDLSGDGNMITTNGDDSWGIFGYHLGTGDIRTSFSGDNNMITTNGAGSRGIEVQHLGTGDIKINLSGDGSMIKTSGRGIYGWHSGDGNIYIDFRNGTITTEETSRGEGIYGVHTGNSGGNVRIDVQSGSITTKDIGIRGLTQVSGSNVEISVADSTITSSSVAVEARNALSSGSDPNSDSTVDIDLVRSTITTEDVASAHAVYGWFSGAKHSGDINIDAQDTTILTKGERAHGIYGYHRYEGDININLMGDSTITTEGQYSYGIYARFDDKPDGVNTQIGDDRQISVMVGEGSAINVNGEGLVGVKIGRLSVGDVNDVRDVAGFDDNGLRQQTVVVNGAVMGGSGWRVIENSALPANTKRTTFIRASGIWMAGGGTVVIGPQGTVGAGSGVAVLATGNTANPDGGDPIKSTLRVDLQPGGRRIKEVIGDDWIINDGGNTYIIVNGVPLHDGETGATGEIAPNGLYDVSLREEGVTVDHITDPDEWVISAPAAGVIADRDFSAEDFVLQFAPQAATYEVTPVFVHRLTDAVSGLGLHSLPPPLLGTPNGPDDNTDNTDTTRNHNTVFGGSGRVYAPEAPMWFRIGAGNGSYKGGSGSDVGAEYDYRRFMLEAGADVPMRDGFTASVSGRMVSAVTDVSTETGGSTIDTDGFGVSAGLSWSGSNGVYGQAMASGHWYKMDMTSDMQGTLAEGVDATVYSLGVEAGRRFAVDDNAWLTARAWLNHSEASVDAFTDPRGVEVSAGDSSRSVGGLGAVLETRMALNSGADLSVRGALGIERELDGEISVIASGEELVSEARENTMLLGIGATLRTGNFTLDGSLETRGLGTDDTDYTAYLGVRMAF